MNSSQIILGLLQAERVAGGKPVQLHVHEGDKPGTVRLCLRDSDQRFDAHQMMVHGWCYDSGTSDWYFELEEGCE